MTRIRVKPVQMGVYVSYHDKNLDDDYSWQVKTLELPPNTVYGSATNWNGIKAYGCKVTQDLINLPLHQVVLQYFDLQFANSDHEIEKIKVLLDTNPNTGNPYLEVCFQDDGADDGFWYDIGYAMVPGNYASGSTRSTAFLTSDAGEDSANVVTASGFMPALVGFEFSFWDIFWLCDTDRHLDKISVDLSRAGKVNVCFRDKYYTFDDSFEWQIWYALMKK